VENTAGGITEPWTLVNSVLVLSSVWLALRAARTRWRAALYFRAPPGVSVQANWRNAGLQYHAAALANDGLLWHYTNAQKRVRLVAEQNVWICNA
jgi:hypothetical protein